MDHPAPWCDAFNDWCFQEAYGVSNAKGLLGGDFNDYTVASAQLYKNKGAWYTSNPKVGDQIFFKNSERICHTGIVYKVTSTHVYTIEGNTSGASGVIANGGGVCKKSYPLNYNKIAGYGHPKYDTTSNSSATSNKIEIITKKTIPTSITTNVRSIQKWLNDYYNTGLIVDGIYGKKTKAALIKAWQTEAGNLTIDGDFGPKSKEKAKSINVDKGDKGIFVTILQATLLCQGYAPGYIDGDFGAKTKASVLAVQKKYNLVQDGIVGSNTWNALFN